MSESRLRSGAAEFILIVVGVLVALAVESGWSSRQDRVEGAEYLESLLDEARSNASTIENVLTVSDAKRAALQRAQTLLSTGQAEDSAVAFLGGLLQGSGISVVPQLSRAVFDDLNSGRLSLIDDDTMRRAIMAHYASVDAMVQRQARWEAAIAPGLHALVSRHVPLGLSEQAGARVSVSRDDEDQAALHEAVRRLAAHEGLEGEIGAAQRALDAERAVLQQLASMTESHAEALTVAIDRTR